jgi:hypothetical protein
MTKTIYQCKSCPWRVDCEPARDIPYGYSCDLHERLRDTIATDTRISDVLRIMACHYSKPGEEYACAGWLYNQLGAGNNITLRLAVMSGRLAVPEVDGEQHATFDATLPA